MAKIGRYHIVEELGNGEMASVYLARDPFIKRDVAIKVLAYELTRDPLFRNFFYQEAEAIASLEHPTIVPIYDFGLHGVQPYIVMRYMPNGSLQSRLKKRGLNRQELCDLMGRIAEGLDEAHAQGIVHRDVKPGNIMITNAGVAKLCDLGLAIDVKDEVSESLDQPGTAVGTPFYMSPEQVESKRLPDVRSDLYSLGATLYRMVVGEVPFNGATRAIILSKHLLHPLKWPKVVNPSLSDDLCLLIGKMLGRDPNERYQTVDQLVLDMEDFLAGRTPRVAAVRVGDGRQRHTHGRGPELAGAAVRSWLRADADLRLVVTHADRAFIEEVHFGSTPGEASRVWWDISWLWGPPEDHLQLLLETVGVDRFVFGTGQPLRLPEAALAKLDLLDLPAKDRHRITAGNLSACLTRTIEGQ